MIQPSSPELLTPLTDGHLAGVRPGMTRTEVLAVLPSALERPGSSSDPTTNALVFECPADVWPKGTVTLRAGIAVHVQLTRAFSDRGSCNAFLRVVRRALDARLGPREASSPKSPTWALGPQRVSADKVTFSNPSSFAVFLRLSEPRIDERVREALRASPQPKRPAK